MRSALENGVAAPDTTRTYSDSYYCFKKQLDVFVCWLRTGEEPFPFSETVELMRLVISGLRSHEYGGREVFLDEIEV